MEWKDFLSHPGVNVGTPYHRLPNGKELFCKLSHDVLECLNTIKEGTKLASVFRKDISEDTLLWFAKWLPWVDNCLLEITPLAFSCTEETNLTPNWPELIAQIDTVLANITAPQSEAQSLKLPSEEIASHIVGVAVQAIERLRLIGNDIHNQEYLRLWTLDYKRELEVYRNRAG